MNHSPGFPSPDYEASEDLSLKNVEGKATLATTIPKFRSFHAALTQILLLRRVDNVRYCALSSGTCAGASPANPK